MARFLLALALALLAFVVAPQAQAATYNLTPSTPGWATTLANLQAGDVAILSAGTFNLNSYFELNLQGTASAGITIRGAGASQTIIKQNVNQNVVNLQGQYYAFYDMSFTGGSRGIRMLSGHHATFDGVNVYGIQSSGFSANDVGQDYSFLTLRRMEIWDVNCFYLGCNYDDCRVHDSVVELSFCHDTVNAAVGYGSAIQLKTGSYRNIIRDNVVYNTGGPGILIYDDFQRGVNVVEGNVIVGTNDNGLQLSSGAIIRNNIIVNAALAGIYVANNQNQVSGVYHDILLEHNTVYGSGSYDLYLPQLSGSGFVFANNAFLSSNAFYVNPQSSTVWLRNAYVSGSLPSGVPASGIFQVSIGAVTSAANNNFYPSSGSALINAGSTAYTPRATIDFNRTPRSGSAPTVGAYEYTTATNPGWTISRSLKTFPVTASPAASRTSSPTRSPLASQSRTAAPSVTRTPIPASPSRSAAASVTRTPAPPSPSRSAAASPTQSATRTPAPPSPSRSAAASVTRTPAPPSPSRSAAASPTRSATRTPVPPSPSRSAAASPSRSPVLPSASRTSTPSSSPASRTFYLTPTSDWVTTLMSLQAGDTAVLAAGTYVLQDYFALDLQGTSAARIVIRGAGASQTIIEQWADENVMNVQGQYFSFYDMSFTGGSRGVRLGPMAASYATFDGVNIYNTGSTAFSASDDGVEYSNLVLRRMEIHSAGASCYYLGCGWDVCRVRDSLIENNYCHDNWDSGIQIVTGSYRNIIRDNVLVNNPGPGVLLYDSYQRGSNLVQGNVVFNSGDNGIQVSAGVQVRNNIVVGSSYYGIYVSANQLQQSGVWHNVQIAHNNVYGSASADLYLPALTGSQFVIANNALLSSSGAFYVGTQTNTVWVKNAYVNGYNPSGVAAGGTYQVALSAVANAAANNFYPSSGSALIGAGSAAYSSPAPKDFNGTPRSGSTPTVGAYEYTTSTNPGPAIGPFFKTITSQ